MGELTTTVEGVQSTVLVGVDLEDLAVNLESGVLDSVGVASGNTTQVRVLLVDLVVGGIVETEDDVALNTVDVLDEEVADRGAVGDEVGADTFAGDLVLAVLVDGGAIALGEGEERQSREGEEAGEHCFGIGKQAVWLFVCGWTVLWTCTRCMGDQRCKQGQKTQGWCRWAVTSFKADACRLMCFHLTT